MQARDPIPAEFAASLLDLTASKVLRKIPAFCRQMMLWMTPRRGGAANLGSADHVRPARRLQSFEGERLKIKTMSCFPAGELSQKREETIKTSRGIRGKTETKRGSKI